MSDLYQNAVDKYKNSPSIVILFVLAVVMFLIGANHFIEDTYSSKYGLENLERAYNLNVQIFDWSYWTMSLAPQISSIVFAYLYLSNTNRKWTGWIAGLSQAMDFFADSWYRSNGQLMDGWGVAGISTLLTFVYFSVGSELFVSVGAGLIIKMFAPFLSTWRGVSADVERSKKTPHTQEKHGGFQKSNYVPKHKPSHLAHFGKQADTPEQISRMFDQDYTNKFKK